MTDPVDERVMAMIREEVANQSPSEREANRLLLEYFLARLTERDRELVTRFFGLGCPMDEEVQSVDVAPVLTALRREREKVAEVRPFVVRLVEIIDDAKRELSDEDFNTFVAVGAAEVK